MKLTLAAAIIPASALLLGGCATSGTLAQNQVPVTTTTTTTAEGAAQIYPHGQVPDASSAHAQPAQQSPGGY